jgi:acyl transferase domain-containing protein
LKDLKIKFYFKHSKFILKHRNSRALLANRISFSMGFQGPSLTVDTACSSSMYALDLAFSAIQNNSCDAAIVGGANLLLHPYPSLQFAKYLTNFIEYNKIF